MYRRTYRHHASRARFPRLGALFFSHRRAETRWPGERIVTLTEETIFLGGNLCRVMYIHFPCLRVCLARVTVLRVLCVCLARVTRAPRASLRSHSRH